jgi:hypothetical protein
VERENGITPCMHKHHVTPSEVFEPVALIVRTSIILSYYSHPVSFHMVPGSAVEVMSWVGPRGCGCAVQDFGRLSQRLTRRWGGNARECRQHVFFFLFFFAQSYLLWPSSRWAGLETPNWPEHWTPTIPGKYCRFGSLAFNISPIS